MAQPQPHSDFTSILKIQPMRCSKCGEKACIIRRSPDHDGSEIWSFQCDNGHITEISGQR